MRGADSEPERPWYLTRRVLVSAVFLAAVAAVGVYVGVTGPSRETEAGQPNVGRQTETAVTGTPPGPIGQVAAPTVPGANSPAVTKIPPRPSNGAAGRTASGTAGGAAGGTEMVIAGGPDAMSTSVCGLPAGPQELPRAAPTATWRILGGLIAAPSSPIFGPGSETGGVPGCFAHDPTGALFAAVNTLALTGLPAGQVDPVAVVVQRASHTAPGYPAALADAHRAAAAATDGGMPAEPSTTPKVAFLGFVFLDYTPARAVLQVAVGVGDPLRTATYYPMLLPVVMVWQTGDWRYVYDPAGPTPQPIVGTGQYIAFPA